MPRKYPSIALLIVLFFSNYVYSQCITLPQISVSGNRCVGSELRLNSNIVPSSITWSLAGTVIASQAATINKQGLTVAGGNGAGNNANQLNNPDRLFVDAAGVMYIPDYNNNRVQKWLPGAATGITVAGGNGLGNAANQLNKPSSVFVDDQGNIYVTDQSNGRVQRWAPGATQGVTVASDLTRPTDMFIDKSGNMYVCDQRANVVKKYAPGSQTGAVVAEGYIASGSFTYMNSPTGIFVADNGDLYVCDTDGSRVAKWAAGASPRDGITVVSLTSPLDVSVDCNGNIFVAYYYGNAIVKFQPTGPLGTIVIGNGQGSNPDQLYSPISVFLAGNNVMYVADFNNHRIQRYSTIIDPSFTPTVPGIYTVTANYDCCAPVTETFEVFKGGIPEVTITSSATTICPGDGVTFFAQNVNLMTNPVYQWTLNGAAVGTNADQFQSVTLNNNDNLLCILSSPDACAYKSSDTSNTIQVKIYDTIPPDMGPDIFICPGADTVLKVASTYNSYVWSNNSTGYELPVTVPGKYYVTVRDDCNRSLSDTIMVLNFTPDNNILPGDTAICSYDNLMLKPLKMSLSNLWSNQTTADSLIVYQAGEYWLQSQDEHNCTVRDSIYIDTKTCPPRGIYMPNAFTPDNNGRNDLLKPVIYGKLNKYRFAVFNRWGQMVFNTTDPKKGWNGSLNGNTPDAGTYVWYCTYQLDGQQPKTEKGTVVLIK